MGVAWSRGQCMHAGVCSRPGLRGGAGLADLICLTTVGEFHMDMVLSVTKSELTRRLVWPEQRTLAYDAWPRGCSARSAPRHPPWTDRTSALGSAAVDCNGRVGDNGGVGGSRGGVRRTVCGIRYGADARLMYENDDEDDDGSSRDAWSWRSPSGALGLAEGGGVSPARARWYPTTLACPLGTHSKLSVCLLRPRDQ